MPIPMTVASLAIDPNTKAPFVVLRDAEQKFVLPIWIGMFEASAIATEIDKISLPRPMTHDLMKELLSVLGGELKRIEITDLRENTYIAALIVRTAADREIVVDSRPSDAIALALRTRSPIWVHEPVLEKSQAVRTTPAQTPTVANEQNKWEEVLENLPSEAFGKYKM
ncbi:MAG: bifunctional nuclease family protein [Pseudomonadota bacterium]